MNKGLFYGVGVGTGDPELITLKAVRIINENEVLAFPSEIPEDSFAYKTVSAVIPGLKDKTLIALPMPMTSDEKELYTAHINNSDKIKDYLSKGINVVYLTIGDPSIYSSFGYLQKLISDMGYDTEMISGVTSFSSAAARFNIPLVLGKEPIHIVSDINDLEKDMKGSIIIMKSAAKASKEIKERLGNKDIYCIENCGLKNEKLIYGLPEDKTGYFTLIIAKDK